MSTETIIMHSIARRLDAGTYRPRHHAAHITLPAVGDRPRPLELAACAVMGALLGWMLGGGL